MLKNDENQVLKLIREHELVDRLCLIAQEAAGLANSESIQDTLKIESNMDKYAKDFLTELFEAIDTIHGPDEDHSFENKTKPMPLPEPEEPRPAPVRTPLNIGDNVLIREGKNYVWCQITAFRRTETNVSFQVQSYSPVGQTAVKRNITNRDILDYEFTDRHYVNVELPNVKKAISRYG